jgi:hypothetical protein
MVSALHTSRLRRVPWRLARVVAGTTRVALYGMVVAAVVAFFALRAVRAQAAEGALSLGRELVPFKDLLHGVHRVSLNGEPMYVASAVTDQRMGQVLDRWETECASQSGGLAEQLDALPAEAKKAVEKQAPAAWANRLGIWREERDTEGSIICLERREGHGLLDAIHALTTFAKTGDVAAIGNFRYVYVRATDTGATHVLTSFTEGSFNVFKVIGRGGVEPAGTDPPETPRPPESSRMMSAEVDRMYGTYVFASAKAPGDVFDFYRAELPGKGWQFVIGQSNFTTQVWQREGVTMVLDAARKDGDPLTRVAFSQGRTIGPEAAR